MRISFVLSTIGVILRYMSLMILVPCIVALIDKDYNSILPFVVASLVSLGVGYLFKVGKQTEESFNTIKKSEALFIVAMSWVVISLVSGIPYLFYGFSPLDSLFEAVSGVTTTGATILTNFDYPNALFLWRSLSQWLGGMGIIVLFVAILPQFRVAGREMFFAEAPGPTEEKVTPRIRNTATALWGVYVFLTALQVVCYKVAGMNLFDAICNSFSTLAAGGFSPNSESIMGYGSSKIVWITVIFMFLSGANFALQYKVLVQRKFSAILKSEEFKLYLGLILVLSFGAALALYFKNHYSVVESVRNGLFQIISIMTTTGFASMDFNQWGAGAKVILFVAMFTGACAGSAAGGIKIVRILYIFRYLKTEIVKILHPNAVVPIKIDRRIIPDEVGRRIVSFLVFYFIIYAIVAFLVAMIEQNVVIGITGGISTLGNVGPAFGVLGPMSSFGSLQAATKVIFIFSMLIGRLELIPFLAMLHPDFWKVKS